MSNYHFSRIDYELTSSPLPEGRGDAAGWFQYFRSGRQVPPAAQWQWCCKMSRWSRWNRRNCRTRWVMRYLPSCRTRPSCRCVQLQIQESQHQLTFDSWRGLLGVETAPRTMAEAAMKVKSLANIVKIWIWICRKKKKNWISKWVFNRAYR